MSNGWVYVAGQPVWRPSVELVMAEQISQLYGEEYESRKEELEDLVKATRRECAAEIKAACRTLPEGSDWFSGMHDAAGLIDPDKGES